MAATQDFRIDLLAPGRAVVVLGRIMRSSSDYFSYEPTIGDYCAQAQRESNFALVLSVNNIEIGFAILSVLNESTIEIITMAVMPSYRRRGLGSALLASIDQYARSYGSKFLLMKIIGPSQNEEDSPYQFLRKRKFCMLDEFDYIWQGFYCAVMIKEAC